MLLTGLSVQGEGSVDEIQSFIQPALSPAQRGFEIEDLGLDLDVPRSTAGQAVFRLDKGVLGAPQLAEDPARVAEMSKAPGAQVQHPVWIIGAAEMTDDPERQVRQLHRTSRIAEGPLPALLEKELTETPGVQFFALL